MAEKKAPVIERLALIGVGLIGSSIARAARATGAASSIVATSRSAATRKRVAELGIADRVVETNAEAAKVLGLSEPTVKRYWDYSRAWLLREIRIVAAGG